MLMQLPKRQKTGLHLPMKKHWKTSLSANCSMSCCSWNSELNCWNSRLMMKMNGIFCCSTGKKKTVGWHAGLCGHYSAAPPVGHIREIADGLPVVAHGR